MAVVKAQVHAGGRGKAGFVKVVKSIDEALAAAKFMLGNRMKSPQTPPEGLEVNRLLIADAVEIAHEFYVAVLVDRANRTNTLIASAEGGVEIEKVAETRPEAIIRIPLDPVATAIAKHPLKCAQSTSKGVSPITITLEVSMPRPIFSLYR